MKLPCVTEDTNLFDNLKNRPDKPTSQEIADIITPKPQGVVADTAWTIYSPNEHRVGMWQQIVDGVLKQKPVYEITTIYTIPSEDQSGGVTYTINSGIQSGTIDNVVHLSGTVLEKEPGDTSYDAWFAINSRNNGDNKQLYAWINRRSAIRFYIKTNLTTFQGNDARFVIRYTKTTDTWQTVE